jgi:hypothetical protein
MVEGAFWHDRRRRRREGPRPTTAFHRVSGYAEIGRSWRVAEALWGRFSQVRVGGSARSDRSVCFENDVVRSSGGGGLRVCVTFDVAAQFLLPLVELFI